MRLYMSISTYRRCVAPFIKAIVNFRKAAAMFGVLSPVSTAANVNDYALI